MSFVFKARRREPSRAYVTVAATPKTDEENAGSVVSRQPPWMEVNRMDAMNKRQARRDDYFFPRPVSLVRFPECPNSS